MMAFPTFYPRDDGLLRGVDILADTVKVTLGPQGRNIISKSYNALCLAEGHEGAAITRN